MKVSNIYLVIIQVFSDVKFKSSIIHGSSHFFNIIQLVRENCTENERAVAFKTLQDNAFWAHPENVLLAMCGKYIIRFETDL